jgi:hydrogenase-4 component B
VIGLTPILVGPILDAVIANWISASGLEVVSVDSLAPLGNIGTMSIVLFALVVVLGVVLKHRIIPRVGTWDCGYAMPTNRMQYSASSFAQMLVALFHWVLHPGMHRPAIHGLFPKPARMHSHVDDAVLDRLLVPTGQFIAQKLTWFYRFQQGLTQHYVLYILIMVIVMLSIQMPIYTFFAQFFAR